MRTLQGFPRPGEIRRVALVTPADPTPPVLRGGGEVPVRIAADRADVPLPAWLRQNPRLWQDAFRSGAVLLRGFAHLPAAQLQLAQQILLRDPLQYQERSSPRTQVTANLYTSTEYPAHQQIFLHNENSYQSHWPQVLLFYCDQPPASGGQTPIADVRRVLSCLDADVVQGFEQRQIMYVRNFGHVLGLPWQTVFQTSDPRQVDAYCASHGIQTQWLSRDRLRTRSIRPALAQHPRTGERLWFNHAAFFHVSTLGAELAEALLAQCGEEELPNHVYYGDGGRIPDQVIEHVRQAYVQCTSSFDWMLGDLLLLDNMLFAHGRASFTGSRRIYVAMAASLNDPGQSTV